MSTKNFRQLIALIGFIGVVILSASFAINPGPPAGATLPQILAWGRQREVLISVGAWTQVVGSFLQIVLILGILYTTGAIRSFVGLLTATSTLLIMGISLVESSFYLNAVASGLDGNLVMLNISLNLIKSIQHAYTIIPAPALDAGLGLVLLTTPLFASRFGRILGYLGLAFGAVLLVLGFIDTFTPMQTTIDNVLFTQQLWLIAIAVALALATRSTHEEAEASEPAVASIN